MSTYGARNTYADKVARAIYGDNQEELDKFFSILEKYNGNVDELIKQGMVSIKDNSPREAAIIKEHYDEGKTYTRIGELHHISRGRVSAVIRNRLRWLKLWLDDGAVDVSTSDDTLSLDTPLTALGLSPRILNILRRACYETVGDVLKCTRRDLFRLRNAGTNAVLDIIETFEAYGFDVSHWRGEINGALDYNASLTILYPRITDSVIKILAKNGINTIQDVIDLRGITGLTAIKGIGVSSAAHIVDVFHYAEIDIYRLWNERREQDTAETHISEHPDVK